MIDNLTPRTSTRVISVGNVLVGGGNPIRVQSMTNTDTRDVIQTVAQIKRLEDAGCEIVRVSVPDTDALAALDSIAGNISIPLIADIHFNHRLAVAALEGAAAAVRINPGNIGGRSNTLEVISAAADNGKSIRVGVNSGSLEKEILDSYGVCAEAVIESALLQIEILESVGFKDYKVSLKMSSVPLTVTAYTLFSTISDAPLHLGITEAGTQYMGTVKSSVGIGALLLRGIGDTIRVSLTSDPVDEVRAAWAILASSGVRANSVEVISCPTCARTGVDIISLAEAVESACAKYDEHFLVAVMGCAVNGPGEAKHADYGIAAGNGDGLLFRKGRIIKKVPEAALLDELMLMIDADKDSS